MTNTQPAMTATSSTGSIGVNILIRSINSADTRPTATEPQHTVFISKHSLTMLIYTPLLISIMEKTVVLCARCGCEHVPFAMPKVDNDQSVIRCDL